MTGCSLPHIALWVLTLPFRLVGWAVMARRLSELAEDVDPRPDVSKHGYIYQCRECSNSFSERYAAAHMEDR